MSGGERARFRPPALAVAAALGISTFLSAAVGAAQPGSEGEAGHRLRSCLQIEAAEARLACFENALAEDGEAGTGEESHPSPGGAGSKEARGRAERTANEPSSGSRPSGEEERPPPERGAVAEETRTATIVRIVTPRVGPPRFVAADGRIFMQTDTKRGRYPPVPFEAVLQDAARGTMFLVSPLDGPRIRVSLAESGRIVHPD